jgi:hypothetical protein
MGVLIDASGRRGGSPDAEGVRDSRSATSGIAPARTAEVYP